MKKLIFAMVVLAALSAPLFAQEISEGKRSEYFYVGMPIEKVYPYKTGYVVQYRKGNQTAQGYIPLEWFSAAEGRVKSDLLFLGPGRAGPYLNVFYKNGEFSHVRLYVRRNQRHETWGYIPMSTNLDDRFENIEDFKFEF